MTTPPDAVGLCLRCIHARIVRTPRSTFWRCALAETDPRFDKYPRLPVVRCDGHAPRPDGKTNGPDDIPSGP